VAEHETATVSNQMGDGTAPAAPASRAEAIGAIEDTLVRRFVQLAVHVRGYAPYYVATLALFAFLAFGPRPDSDNGDDAAFGANEAAAAGAGAGSGGSGSDRGGGTAPALSPAAAGTLIAGAAGFDGVTDGGDGAVEGYGVMGDVVSGTALPETPAAPDVPSFDAGDVDYGTDLPEACTVRLPSPAPAVSPSREVDGAQTTVEAVAGLEAPADLAPYVEDAASATGCPDVPVLPAPALPLPAVPGLPV